MIKRLIDEFYQSKKENKKRINFWISEVGKCPRAIYFNFKDFPKKELEPRVSRVLHHGEYVHLRIMSVLFSLGLVRASEIEIPKQGIIRGKADAILYLDGKLYVVEIKSINRFGFERLDKPEPDHLKQLQLYLHFFNLKRGILIYECKDSQDIKEFYVEKNEGLVGDLIDGFSRLKEQIEGEELPDIPQDLEGWKCKCCVYEESCKRVSDQRKTSFL